MLIFVDYYKSCHPYKMCSGSILLFFQSLHWDDGYKCEDQVRIYTYYLELIIISIEKNITKNISATKK